jgi:hypothetical protein
LRVEGAAAELGREVADVAVVAHGLCSVLIGCSPWAVILAAMRSWEKPVAVADVVLVVVLPDAGQRDTSGVIELSF